MQNYVAVGSHRIPVESWSFEPESRPKPPKRLFPGTPKVRRDQADRMLVKLKQRGHTRAQATAALVSHIWDVLGWKTGVPKRFRHMFRRHRFA